MVLVSAGLTVELGRHGPYPKDHQFGAIQGLLNGATNVKRKDGPHSNGVVAKPGEQQAVRRGWPLVRAVAATVVGGLLGAAAATIVLNFLANGRGARRMLQGNLGTDELDVIKIALSVIAGVGGAVALVVAYQNGDDAVVAGAIGQVALLADELDRRQPTAHGAGLGSSPGQLTEVDADGGRYRRDRLQLM